jgi:hypothetical protein
MQPTVRDIDTALEALRSEDPMAAQGADSAIQWLTGGEGFDGVTQQELQDFLWYTLPKKFLAPVEAQLEVADASGGCWRWWALPGTRPNADPRRRASA